MHLSLDDFGRYLESLGKAETENGLPTAWCLPQPESRLHAGTVMIPRLPPNFLVSYHKCPNLTGEYSHGMTRTIVEEKL